MASLLTLLTSLAHDASNNFKQLLNVREEQVVVIDEDGKEKTVCMPAESPENPFRLLKMLSWTHWLHFFSGFLLLLVDSLDFNLLAVQTKKIALYFGTSKSVIASSITYTLLLRPVGALLFCVVSDYSGRRYPLFFAGLMLATLQIATIYCRSLSSFLGVRALFGIAMGSIYGSSAAMAMDNCPTRARGLVSGMLASYGAVAYVVAAFMNLEAGSDPLSWKKTFWISSGLTFAAAFIRLAVPEAQQFKDLKEKSEHAPSGMKKVKAFISDFNTAMKVSWKRFFYMIVLVTSIIFLIHAFTDSYITYMLQVKGMNNTAASELGMTLKSGGWFGKISVGYLSQYIGRRRLMVVCSIMTLILIPALILPTTFSGLAAGGFFFDFFADGVVGVIPIHLNELAPPQFRALLPGVAYQLGAMISSPSSQIVNIVGEGNHVMYRGKEVEAYGPVIIVFVVICATVLLLCSVFGPERRGSHFEVAAAAGTIVSQDSQVSQEGEKRDEEKV